MRRYLVVANRTLGAPELTQMIRKRHAEGPCEFYLLAPATPPGNPADWYGALTTGLPAPSPADRESSERARMRLDTELARLGQQGVAVAGEVGGPDPFRAVSDLLARRQFDEIIVSTRSPGVSRWLHWDLPSRIERKFRLPVTHVVVGEGD